MKHIYLFMAIIFLPLLSQAQSLQQELLSSSSGSLKNDNFSINWTIGEIAVESYSTPDLILTQGLLQNRINPNVNTSINDSKTKFRISPNPFSSSLEINSTIENSYSYEILDISGKQITIGLVSSKLISINTSSIPKGIYLIRIITSQNEIIYTQKLIK